MAWHISTFALTSVMIKRALFKAAQKLVLQPYFRQTRGMTLGIRALAIGEGPSILLVRHTYAPGWLLPGGGVERGETLVESCLRELREEAALTVLEQPVFHGIFLNDKHYPGDHVACFVVRKFEQGAFSGNAEIAEARFFPVSDLPDTTTPGTRRRIAEVLEGRPPDREW